MYKVSPLVLAAALFGLEATAVAAADCYALYSSSGTYQAGDVVSADVTESETVDEQCTPGSSGCSCDAADAPSTNCKKSVTRDVDVRYNFECTTGASSVFCGDEGYAPGSLHSGQAWTKDGTECTITATPATVAPPAEWSEGGCPAPYELGTEYAPAAAVSVATNNGYSLVYKCKAEPYNLFCGQTGYQPGGSNSGLSWTLEGSCDGTLSPSSAVAADVGEGFLGGCPGEWESRDIADPYLEGDRISKDGVVYECKAWPNNLHCGQDGYEPLKEGDGTPTAWLQAWTVKGTCSGTIAPTSSPSFVSLQDMGGCPAEWELRDATDPYEEDDKVAADGIVYACRPWPFSAHCGQAGYEPNTNPATPDAWKDAWTVVGHCSGSLGPTGSPTFDDLKPLIDGCPPEWVANTKYDAEDQVTVVVSDAPERKIVYECKEYPYSGYCGQFDPASKWGYLGWELKSACEGTIAPTAAPVPYGGTCFFDLCRDVDVKKRCTYNPNDATCKDCTKTTTTGVTCSQGTLGCSCDNQTPPTCTKSVDEYSDCEKEVTESICLPDVGAPAYENWASFSAPFGDFVGEISAGDVVRIGTKRFKAKVAGWARQDAYMPTLEDTGLWTQAWTSDGVCDPNQTPAAPTTCMNISTGMDDCLDAGCSWATINGISQCF